MLGLKRWFLFLLLLIPVNLPADSGRTVDEILELPEAPPGVVFEIVTSDEDGLEWALPMTRSYIERLQQRFPDLHIAVVTHGQEQFALQNADRDTQRDVHAQVQSLTGNDIPVYVCGTYAGWRGLSDEDFPGYVNVAAAGPAQINDFIALGYSRVLVQHPPD